MLFIDYNSSIRDIFKQVEGVSQHGLEELFDEEVVAGRRSYSESIIAAGLASGGRLAGRGAGVFAVAVRVSLNTNKLKY